MNEVVRNQVKISAFRYILPDKFVCVLYGALSDIFGVEVKNCEKLNNRMVESNLKGGKFNKR